MNPLLSSVRRRRTGLVLPPLVLAAACGRSVSDPSVVAAVTATVPAPAAPVATVAAAARVLPQLLEVSGDLRADAQVDVAAEVEGRIVRADVERGQFVEEGQVLFALDPRDAEHRLAEALAVQRETEARLGLQPGQELDPEQTPDVRQAHVAMALAEIEAKRRERLVADRAVPRSEYDVKVADFLQARERYQAQVHHARELGRALEAQVARVALAQKALADTEVRAPWRGAVLQGFAETGQHVRPGERLCTLVRVDPLRAELAIPECAIAAVGGGQQVALAVRSRPGQPVVGTVTFVGPGLDPQSRALTVEALVDNRDGALQPGLFVTAQVELPGTEASVVVPRAAVHTAAGVHHVLVVTAGRVERRYLQLGRECGADVEVRRGLAAGEAVVVQSTSPLTDGVAVVAAAREEL